MGWIKFLHIILKSLLFSAFSLVEGYLNDIIDNKITEIKENISEEELITKLVHSALERKKSFANGWKSKINLFNELFEVTTSTTKIQNASQKQKTIRNTLAHDITSATISADCKQIYIRDLKPIYIGNIFTILKKCAIEMNELINKKK